MIVTVGILVSISQSFLFSLPDMNRCEWRSWLWTHRGRKSSASRQGARFFIPCPMCMDMEMSTGDANRETDKSLQDYTEARGRNVPQLADLLVSRRNMEGLSKEAAREAIRQGVPPSVDDAVAGQLGHRLDQNQENLKELSQMATGKTLASLQETPEDRVKDL